ncbi:Pds5a [Symbiodinium natans]|nr:Pds5a [Symbiodinium natans]CAE7482839.1 Pds5a [Symbiodinium natans]
MLFSLVEKKTFLEYVPSKAETLTRSSSLPLLPSTWSSTSEHLQEEPDELTNKVPKLFLMSVRQHSIECTESDLASPGAASMRGSCTAWQLASTRGGSDRSLLTSFIDSTHGGSSWMLEDGAHDVAKWTGPVPTTPHSPQSAISGSGSSTTTGSVQQPSESAGSHLHEAKLCRPCAWYWRPGGCTRGADCLHCHLCADGELQKRRFENRKLAKLRKKQKKEAH